MDTVAHPSSWTPGDASTTTSAPPGSPPYQTIEFAKSTHRQFKDFKVHLLVFDSAQAIKSFVEVEEAFTLNPPILLNPGELVAAALKGDETRHSRHVVILGIIAPASLPEEMRLLIKDLSAGRKSEFTAQHYSVWDSNDDATSCAVDSDGALVDLTARIAQAGDTILREHLYRTQCQSPSLLASEARRIAFGEQYLFAEVNQDWSRSGWIRHPDDDILLPCISFEGLDSGAITIKSKTGYHACADQGSLVVICNQHFPYRRTGGQHYIQLRSSNIVLSEAAVKRHQDNINIRRNAERELQRRRLFDEMRMSVDRAEESFTTNEQQPAIDNFDLLRRNVERLKTQASQLRTARQEDNAAHVIEQQKLQQLMLATMQCLVETFDMAKKMTGIFLQAMLPKEDSRDCKVSEDVMQCFVLCTSFACSAALLCGKEAVQGEQIVEAETEQSPVVTIANEREASVPYEELPRELRGLTMGDRQRQPHSFTNCTGESSKIPGSSLSDESPSGTRKRPLESTLDDDSKSAIQDNDTDNSTAKKIKTEPGRESIKPLLQFIVEETMYSGRAKLQFELTEQFKRELTSELPQAKRVSPEAVALLRDVNEIGDKSVEDCLLDQSIATTKLYYLMKAGSQDCDWDWIVLSLAYKAIITIGPFADRLAEIFEFLVSTEYIKSSREEDLDLDFYSTFADSVEEISSSSIPFVDFIGHILKEFIKTTSAAKAKESYEGEITVERINSLVSVRPFDEAAYIDSVTSNSSARVHPRRSRQPIRMGWIRLDTNEGSGLEKMTKRFREAVTEVLFEAYLSPLCSYLSTRDLNGDKYDGSSVRCRKLLKLRLDLIQKLFDGTKLDARLFVAKTCSDIVLAPKHFLPLTQGAVDRFSNSNSTYKFPPFMEKEEVPSTEESRSKGWDALYSALRGVSATLLNLVDKRNPGREMIQCQLGDDDKTK